MLHTCRIYICACLHLHGYIVYRMVVSTITVDSVIQGHHVYQDSLISNRQMRAVVYCVRKCIIKRINLSLPLQIIESSVQILIYIHLLTSTHTHTHCDTGCR